MIYVGDDMKSDIVLKFDSITLDTEKVEIRFKDGEEVVYTISADFKLGKGNTMVCTGLVGRLIFHLA